MSSGESPLNIASMLTTFNIEIKALPDDLKCIECKSVLKGACQLSCGCRLCRTCIDGLMVRGDLFCPGDSQECGVTSLSTGSPDYRADKTILKLISKCPHESCSHECPLADMGEHLRVCSGKSVDCPFTKLGCQYGGLTDEEMSDHMQQENCSHNEILIAMVVAIKGDMELMKQEMVRKDEHGIHLENEIKLVKDENESIKNEIESIKDDNKSIREENESIKNEIRSIKIENELIKGEKAVLSERVRQLAEHLKRESYEQASAGINAATEAVVSNRGALGTSKEPVRHNIRTLKDKCRAESMQSLQVPVGLGQLANWLIDEDVGKAKWSSAKTSGKFRGEGRPHTYELASFNFVNTGELCIQLRLWAGPSDAQLQWPFRDVVTVTVAHRDNTKKCSKQTRQCLIDRPKDNQYSANKPIIFDHASLRGAGLDLERGVRVSCQIVPVSDAVSPCATISNT